MHTFPQRQHKKQNVCSLRQDLASIRIFCLSALNKCILNKFLCNSQCNCLLSTCQCIIVIKTFFAGRPRLMNLSSTTRISPTFWTPYYTDTKSTWDPSLVVSTHLCRYVVYVLWQSTCFNWLWYDNPWLQWQSWPHSSRFSPWQGFYPLVTVRSIHTARLNRQTTRSFHWYFL